MADSSDPSAPNDYNGEHESESLAAQPERTGIPEFATPDPDAPYTPPMGQGPQTIAERREDMRGKIAIHLLCLIGVAIVAAFVLLLVSEFRGKETAEAARTLVSAIIAPLIGVFGTVVGFYFGERGASDEHRAPGGK